MDFVNEVELLYPGVSVEIKTKYNKEGLIFQLFLDNKCIFTKKSKENKIENVIHECLVAIYERELQKYLGPLDINTIVSVISGDRYEYNVIIENRSVYDIHKDYRLTEADLLKRYLQRLIDCNYPTLTYYCTPYLYSEIKYNVKTLLKLHNVRRIITQDSICCWIDDDKLKAICILDRFEFVDSEGKTIVLNELEFKQKDRFSYLNYNLSDFVVQEELVQIIKKEETDFVVINGSRILSIVTNNNDNKLQIINAGIGFLFFDSKTQNFMETTQDGKVVRVQK